MMLLNPAITTMVTIIAGVAAAGPDGANIDAKTEGDQHNLERYRHGDDEVYNGPFYFAPSSRKTSAIMSSEVDPMISQSQADFSKSSSSKLLKRSKQPISPKMTKKWKNRQNHNKKTSKKASSRQPSFAPSEELFDSAIPKSRPSAAANSGFRPSPTGSLALAQVGAHVPA